jgi:hypothetical protein
MGDAVQKYRTSTRQFADIAQQVLRPHHGGAEQVKRVYGRIQFQNLRSATKL